MPLYFEINRLLKLQNFLVRMNFSQFPWWTGPYHKRTDVTEQSPFFSQEGSWAWNLRIKTSAFSSRCPPPCNPQLPVFVYILTSSLTINFQQGRSSQTKAITWRRYLAVALEYNNQTKTAMEACYLVICHIMKTPWEISIFPTIDGKCRENNMIKQKVIYKV